MLPLGAIFLGSHLMIAVVDDLAAIDIQKTCHLAAGIQMSPTQDVIKFCINDEHDAHDTLSKSWGTYTAADKLHCVQMATKGYLPSYVELLTCIEMSAFAKAIPQESAKAMPEETARAIPEGAAVRRKTRRR
jgi:hypothetical protein